jgi:transposase-like protein
MSRHLNHVNHTGAEQRGAVNRYSTELKEAILRRTMAPENKPVSALAKENGISEQTLYTWRRNLQSQGVPVPGNGKNAVEWSSAESP